MAFSWECQICPIQFALNGFFKITFFALNHFTKFVLWDQSYGFCTNEFHEVCTLVFGSSNLHFESSGIYFCTKFPSCNLHLNISGMYFALEKNLTLICTKLLKNMKFAPRVLRHYNCTRTFLVFCTNDTHEVCTSLSGPCILH